MARCQIETSSASVSAGVCFAILFVFGDVAAIVVGLRPSGPCMIASVGALSVSGWILSGGVVFLLCKLALLMLLVRAFAARVSGADRSPEPFSMLPSFDLGVWLALTLTAIWSTVGVGLLLSVPDECRARAHAMWSAGIFYLVFKVADTVYWFLIALHLPAREPSAGAAAGAAQPVAA